MSIRAACRVGGQRIDRVTARPTGARWRAMRYRENNQKLAVK
jgi:hypothetical protein